MMLIALSFSAMLLAPALVTSERDLTRESPTVPLPPIVMVVERAPDIPPSLLTDTLAEAAAVWQPFGVSLTWCVVDCTSAAADGHDLHLIMSDEMRPEVAGRLPLGWIGFRTSDDPEPIIHLSRAAALALLTRLPAFPGTPLGRQHVMLARAMGRALAHELGHYLLASDAHTARGLMRTGWSVEALTSVSRTPFDLNQKQRVLVMHNIIAAAHRPRGHVAGGA